MKGMREAVLLVAVVALAASCERDTRRYEELPAAANRDTSVRVGGLEPGVRQGNPPVKGPYDDNAWGMGEGKRLYAAYNCAPCHGANGGGAIGPPLIDDTWIYGAAPDQIYATIAQGRPDGMPSFGGHVPSQQIWQLVAYVRSMSGQNPFDAAPGRNDDQMGALPENRSGPKPTIQTGHR